VTSPSVISNVGSTAFLSLGDDPDDPDLAASDGLPPDDDALINGVRTLETIAPFIFNILCLPDAANLSDGQMNSVYSFANTFCEERRAFLIVDIPPTIDTPAEVTDTWLVNVGDGIRHRNAAVYFPRLGIPDLLNESRPRNVAASGTLAGVYARTDATRGIWKAPAGTEATLRGATPAVKATDPQNGDLNQLGVNTLRTFPIFGHVSWGGRTLEGADQQASEWKYIPVRRTALYIEESLFQGLKWVVFEPNDEPLWAQIRLNVGAFMQNLFRQGAFAGKSPREAYFVKCDKETTTQNDVDRGIVNIIVGFAPLKPAEFVVIKIQQIAGQIQT
jgi:phage tail sheath protein FI